MEDQQLLEYVKSEISRGIPKDVIHKALTAGGWPEGDIKDAFLIIEGTPFVSSITKVQESNISKEGPLMVILVAVVAVLLVSAGIYLYYQRQVSLSENLVIEPVSVVTETASKPPVFDDSDMRLKFDTTLVDCGVINNLTISEEDRATILAYTASTSLSTKADQNVQKIIASYSDQIDFFLSDQNSWADHASVLDTEDKTICNFSNIRTLGSLSLARAKELAFNSNSIETKNTITNILDISQKLQENSQSAIPYLVGFAIKSLTVDLITILNEKNLISITEYKALLEKYSDSGIGNKKALQYEYSIVAEVIDDLAQLNFTQKVTKQFGQEFLSAFKEEKTDFNFEPNNTKLLFLNLFKELYSNVDSPCDTILQLHIPTLDPNDTGENSLGKAIFASNAGGIGSLDNLKNRRCLLENKINNIKEIP